MTRLINWSTLLVLLGALGLALALGLWLMADLGQAEAQLDQLTANAGPDQTVTGSPPIMVEFDGSGTQPFTGSEVVSYQWYNEWGRLKGEGVSPVMKVFAEDHQPGQQRHFRLVVEDSQGNQAEDWVTITLGEESELIADAGPDQTVSGELPIMVTLDGTNSIGEIRRYEWWNQDDYEYCDESCPVITVDSGFTAESKPGDTREFTLIIMDEEGADADTVIITLGAEPTSLDYDPAVGSEFTGLSTHQSFEDGRSVNIDAGHIDETLWYVKVWGDDTGDDVSVTCLSADQHWQTEDAQGCVGRSTGSNGYYIRTSLFRDSTRWNVTATTTGNWPDLAIVEGPEEVITSSDNSSSSTLVFDEPR